VLAPQGIRLAELEKERMNSCAGKFLKIIPQGGCPAEHISYPSKVHHKKQYFHKPKIVKSTIGRRK